MVLIALAIVFAGLGAMTLSKSDSDSSAGTSSSTSAAALPQATTGSQPAKDPSSASPAPTTVAAPSTTPVTTTAAPTLPPTTTGNGATVNHSIPVRVLNNSLVAGLAAKTAGQLRANGWTNTTAGNYPGENIPKTTVYYGNSPGEREAATAIASELGVSAQPKFTGLGDTGSGVVVIVTGN